MRHLLILCSVVGTAFFSTGTMALAQNGMQQPTFFYAGEQADASPSDQAAVAGNSGCTMGDQAACGCGDVCCCDPCCGSGLGLFDCCLGDAWTLHDELTPCSDINYGGWFQMGYHSDYTRLSAEDAQGLSFNDHPDALNLHQAWFFAEKVADAGPCCADWGFRFDILYGLDAQKTQAFGNADNVWDVSLDHGVYGWALPQLYGEVAYGDWSVKAGHFYTLVGYEVVPATGNFFYSHALTMFNSEPFTHTGALATYTGIDDVTVYGGWTLGWDTGFDQFGGGSSFLGGVGLDLTDDVTATYICTAGNLGWRGDGYTHSVVVDANLTCNLEYVLQSDYVTTQFPDGFDNEDVGINQYLFYTVNDCLAVGSRLEWWKSNNDANTGINQATSFYEVTFGVNYKPQANVVVRPEIRYDWTPADVAFAAGSGGVDYDQTVFGIDMILTY